MADRDDAGRFLVGQSGNPRGRPPLPAEFRSRLAPVARAALELFDDVLSDPAQPLAMKLVAARSVLRMVPMSGGGGDPVPPPPLPGVVLQVAEVSETMISALGARFAPWPGDSEGLAWRRSLDLVTAWWWCVRGELRTPDEVAAIPRDENGCIRWGWLPRTDAEHEKNRAAVD